MARAMAVRKVFSLAVFFILLGGLIPKTIWAACPQRIGDQCTVTSARGDLAAGSFLSCLQDNQCKKIVFGVFAVEPLKAWAEVNGGKTIDGQIPGGGRIELTYDLNSNWPNNSYQDCLLRIKPIPPNPKTEGVTLSNLNVRNPFGAGVCVQENTNSATPNGNKLSRMKIQSGENALYGLDLGASDDNKINDVTVIGENAPNSYGIYMRGDNNEIKRGKIEGFQWGVHTTSTGSLNTITQAQFFKILEKPILYVSGQSFRAQAIKAAFVTSSGWTLTGKAHNATKSIEVYKVETASIGKNYRYLFTISDGSLLERQTPTALAANERRFKYAVSIAATGLSPTNTISLLAQVEATYQRTAEFSDSYSGTDPILGSSQCNQPANSWFWYSYDFPLANHLCNFNTNPDCLRGWHADWDGDGLANGFCTVCGHEANRSEDLDKDCVVDSNESKPNDWRSQYDFDCDDQPDFQGDNCKLFLRPNGSEYLNLTEYPGCQTNVAINAANFKSWNPDQADSDNDGLGDACETDIDNDGVVDGEDNCSTVFNPDQRDSDGNGVGDACTRRADKPAAPLTDADEDGRKNLLDNCPFDGNFDQKDTDGDKVGDVCDFDDDNDGLTDGEETNPKNPDSDFDLICDGPDWGFAQNSCIRPLDNCPLVANQDQLDQDEDGIGDACDASPRTWRGEVDSDGDGVLDGLDNCPTLANAIAANGMQNDNDNDTVGDPCDSDDDNDGLEDATESGRFDPRRRDLSGGYKELHLAPDSDGDGYVDGVDVCLNFPNPAENAANPVGDQNVLPDSDCGRYNPVDIDNDGRNNATDNCVFIPNRYPLDLDGDGKGNACDLDDDNDNSPNANDFSCWDYLRYIDGTTVNTVAARNVENCNPNLQSCFHCDFDESANFRLHPWDPNSDHETGRIFDRPDFKCDGTGTGFGLPTAMTRCEPSDFCPEFFNPQGSETVCGPSAASPNISSVIDFDVDGAPDTNDNCPDFANADQFDMNHNGVGDACDTDIDGDLVLNENDNCLASVNPSQADTDGDGLGDDCDPNPTSKNAPQIRGAGSAIGGCMLVIPQKGPDTSWQTFLLKPLLKSVTLAAWPHHLFHRRSRLVLPTKEQVVGWILRVSPF